MKIHQTNDHLSVMAGISPQRQLYSLIRTQAISKFDTVTFLHHLMLCIAGKLLVIWDGSPIHRAHEVKQFLADGAAKRIHIEPLPPYAPDLNPAEGIWDHLKFVEMRNLCCQNLENLHSELSMAIERLRSKPRYIEGFFKQAKCR